MNIEEIKSFLEQNKESEEVKGYIDTFKTPLQVDSVKDFLNSNEEGKKYLQSYGDKRVSEGIDSWKKNNLEQLVQAELLKKNPKLTPEQLEIQNIKAELEKEKGIRKRAEMVAKYKDVLVSKNIPSELTDFILAEDEEVVNANITLFENSMKNYIESQVNNRLKGSSYTPPSNGKASFTMEDLKNMTPEEINKNWDIISKIK